MSLRVLLIMICTRVLIILSSILLAQNSEKEPLYFQTHTIEDNWVWDKAQEKTGHIEPRSLETANITRRGAGDYQPKLSERTFRQSDNVVVEIEDNGSGIPKKMKDKILQPFFTTKEGTAGTGLGLSITNDIIKAHSGQLSISETSDEGATFRIRLRDLP